MRKIAVLCGGVGGARFAQALYASFPDASLNLIVNVGDDFEHLGLKICPDLDTVYYTLTGRNDEARGWGVAGESWHCLESLSALGAESWFQLGDWDLALHLARTEMIRKGARLTEVCVHLVQQSKLKCTLLPVTDDPLRTQIRSRGRVLDFQEYFVRERCAPVCDGVLFAGAEKAQMTPEVKSLLTGKEIDCLMIAPSNPYLSIAPMLAIPGVREALHNRQFPVIAISPLIGGQAIKGPLVKIMAERGMSPSPASIAQEYAGLIDGLVCDIADQAKQEELEAMGVQVKFTETLMSKPGVKKTLAEAALAFAQGLGAAEIKDPS